MEDISAVLVPQPPVLDVPELRRHLKQRLKTSPVLRPHLSNLEQMLKSWDGGGNRAYLRVSIERTIREIEKETDFGPLLAAFANRDGDSLNPQPAA
jgi:hypothetical protein